MRHAAALLSALLVTVAPLAAQPPQPGAGTRNATRGDARRDAQGDARRDAPANAPGDARPRETRGEEEARREQALAPVEEQAK
jgi:hypothetical protein